MNARLTSASALLLLASSLALAESPPAYLGEWGGSGSAGGKFSGASGIAIDAAGTVYVADPGNDRVQIFDALGNYRSEGHLMGGADIPRDVTLMPDGSILSCSSSFGVFVRYALDTSPIFGHLFPVNPPLTPSYGCACDSRGFIYATGITTGTVRSWTPAGTAAAGSFQGFQPAGIAVAPGGDVYVAFAGDNAVRHYTQDLVPLGSWGSSGSGPGQFNGPYGIAVDRAGDVYVADTGNDRVQKFTAAGALLAVWGTHGSGPGQFNEPVGIEINGHGDVYVSDFLGNRVQRFGLVVVATQRTSWGRVKTLFR